MSETPKTDKFREDHFIQSSIGPYERGHNDCLRTCMEFAKPLEKEVARLAAQLADSATRQLKLERIIDDMTADRDSWSRQNDDRVADCLRLGKEIDRLKAELGQCRCKSALRADEIQRLTGELAGRHTGSEVVAWMQWMGETGDNVESWPIDEVTDNDVGIAAWKARQKEER